MVWSTKFVVNTLKSYLKIFHTFLVSRFCVSLMVLCQVLNFVQVNCFRCSTLDYDTHWFDIFNNDCECELVFPTETLKSKFDGTEHCTVYYHK